MKQLPNLILKIVICLFLVRSSENLYSQPASEFDEIVFKIYNQNFNTVPAKIGKLKKTSPQIANYLQIDYLWWEMISFNCYANESEFIAALKGLNNPDKNGAYQVIDRLIYFTYQIRYENFKNRSFSKYLTMLKFHLFMENTDFRSMSNPDSFIISMFRLTDELNMYMKYQFLLDHGFSTKSSAEKCRLSLLKTERMFNPEYKSFDVVKTYLLAKIYLEIEKDNQKAFVKFRKLSILFPENIIFKKAVSDCKKQ